MRTYAGKPDAAAAKAAPFAPPRSGFDVGGKDLRRSSGSPLYDFARIPTWPQPKRVLQRALTVNRPGDRYEREADRVAERVMRMPEPQAEGGCQCGGTCPRCKARRQAPPTSRLQTETVGSGGVAEAPVPGIVHDVLRSPAQPLDPATRGFMERRFGHDFSQVKVHSGARAAESAAAVDAAAYTVGQSVVFGEGRYAPATTEGRKLLAHELVHVLQQSDPSLEPRVRRTVAGEESGARDWSALTVSQRPGAVLARRDLIGEERYTACTDPPYYWPQTCDGRENTRFSPEPVEVMTAEEWRQHMQTHDFARTRERTFLRAVYISDAEYEDWALENQRGFFDFTLVDHDVEASRSLDREPSDDEKLAFAEAIILRGGSQQADWRYEQALIARFIGDWQLRVLSDEARAGNIFTREQAEEVVPERPRGSLFNPASEPVGLAMIESATAMLELGLTTYIHAYDRDPDERADANRMIQSAGNVLRQGAETLDEISREERQRLEAAINVLVDFYSLPGASDASRVVRSIFKASVTPSIGGALADTDSVVDRMLRIQSGTIQFLEDFDYAAYGHSGDTGQDLKERLQTMVRSLLQ